MQIEKIPHSYSVRLYKNMLRRKQIIEERIDALNSVEKEGFLTSCFNTSDSDATENTQRILNFLNEPSRESWDNIYNLNITMEKSFWKVWCDYDPQARREISKEDPLVRRWPSFPDPHKTAMSALSALKNERADLVLENYGISQTIDFMRALYPVLLKKSPDLEKNCLNDCKF